MALDEQVDTTAQQHTPDDASPHDALTEAAAQDMPFYPKARVATFDVCFAEDNAISLNGRQYPKDIIDTLIANAQRTLTDPNHPPITCYINHGESDNDDTLKLVGKVTKVWREGTKAMASIDIPDTTAGRDVAALVAHRYIITQSLRASGVTLSTARNRSMPQVVEAPGETATLQGIDFTSTPGLDKTARIGKVLLESDARPGVADAFDLPPLQESSMNESAQLSPQTSGDSQSTDGTATQDSYGKKRYQAASLAASGSAANLPAHPAMTEAHDRSASLLGLPCAGAAKEHGKVLNKENADHAAAIHDSMAEALGKPCTGHGAIAANAMSHSHQQAAPAASDPDGDDDTTQESHDMTPEEMLEALKSRGYTVEAPKTQAQVLSEKIAALEEAASAREAALQEQMSKMVALLEAKNTSLSQVQEAAPVRRSLAESANWQERPTNTRRQSYVKECLDRMTDTQFSALADRTQPLPDHLVDPKNPKAGIERMLKEFGNYALAQYDQKFGLA